MSTIVEFADLPFVDKVDYVRARVTPFDLVTQMGDDDFVIVGDKIVSPYNPSERHPSCHLYEDGFYDFSSGRGGDVVDLYMALTGSNIWRALDRLAQLADRVEAEPGDFIRRTPVDPPDLTDQFRAMPVIDRLGECWVNRLRPITAETLNELVLALGVAGDEERLFIPHWHDSRVRGIKIRDVQSGKRAVPGSTFACGLYWPLPQVDRFDRPDRPLIICEGESDSWCLIQTFPYADIASLPAGAGLWKEAWLDSLVGYETVWTVFDNDRAGRLATEKVRGSVGWGRWRELKVPDLFNDVREAMGAGWVPTIGGGQ